ncbi:MAG TPA: TonB-dependent receptor [Steroidobacteraceae bacterium]|jgi:outer membrane receptor protein involved in Fe transport|nr:TonB-dependent receptor [Steroidobacteraceae bacterium]
MSAYRTRHSGRAIPVLASILFGLSAHAVLADSAADEAAGPPAPADRSADANLQEILVTATRRTAPLSKVPLSVTAVSQDQMDQLGVKDIQDLIRFVPGVSIDNSGTNAISIRGISSSGGAGTTGIYLDDTPIQMRAIGFNPDDTLPRTFDLERVEVLRGPQGTLFGAGSEGGTVRYILTPPDLSKASTYARTELSYTRNGEPSYEAGVARGQPLIDGTLGIRVSAWYQRIGGWINKVDPTTGAVVDPDANRGEVLMLRLAAVWQPADSLQITPSLLYQNSRKHDEDTYWPAYSNPALGQFNNATPELMPVPDEYYLGALKIEKDFATTRIISDTSYYHRHELTAYQGTVYDLSLFQGLGWPGNPATGGLGCGSASTTPTPPCSWYPLLDGNGIHLPAGFENYQTPNIMTNSQDSWVQEVRWQSSQPDARINWTIGAFWQLAKESSVEELRDSQVNDFFQALYGVNATDIYGEFYSCPDNSAYPTIPACDIYYNGNTTFDRQIAAYGQADIAITSRLKLTLGERIARTSFSLTNYADGLENYGPSGAQATERETPNTPKVGLAMQMNKANLLYATYAKGFRVGGGNSPLPPYCGDDLAAAGYPNGAPPTYQSDSTQDYEIGSKNAIGGIFRVATSLYYIKWNGIQQSVFIGGNCGLQFTDNLGTAVSKGFDLQANAALGPLQLDFATGYTNARYTRNSPHAGLASAGDAISGEAAIDYAPGLYSPWTVSLGAQYNFSLGSSAAFVRGDWEYESRNPWPSTLQDPLSSQYYPYTYTLPSTIFASLRAGVTLGDWMVAAFVENLTNTHTVTNYQLGSADYFNPDGPPSVQENDYTFRPRTIGITGTLRIGGE